MKKLLAISSLILSLLIVSNCWAATKTISNAGGNWSATTAWVEGAKPSTGDNVVATATSGNLVINENTADLKSFDLTGYTGTLSGTSTIAIRGLTASTNVCKIVGIGTWTGTLKFSPVSTTAVINFTSNANLLTNMTITSGAATSLVVLQDNLSFTAVKTDSITLTTQGLALNGKTISGNSSINRLLITSVTLGTAVALTVNSGTFVNCDFRDINFANGGANLDLSAITGGSGDCGGNGMSGGGTLTFTTADDWYWNADNGNWSNNTKWFTATDGGGTRMDSDARNAKALLPQDNAYFDLNSFNNTGRVVTADMPRLGHNVDFTGVTNNPQLSWSGIKIYGSLTFATNTTSVTGPLTFEGRGACIYTTNSKHQHNLNINMVGGTLTLAGNVDCDLYDVTLNNGTLDADTYNVLVGNFDSNNSNARTLKMGSGTWEIEEGNAGIKWNITNPTNLTGFDAETSSILLSGTSVTNARTFAGGGLTYNNLTVAGDGTGAWTFTASNTFNTFTIDVTSGARSIKFTDGTDTTVSSFVATGNAVNGITFTGTSTAGYKLSDSAGTNTVHYCTIDYATCEGGATWDATDNCVDGRHNSAPDSGLTGWLFTAGGDVYSGRGIGRGLGRGIGR